MSVENAAHDTPLANRLIDDRIREWLDDATRYASGVANTDETRSAIYGLRHSDLATFAYLLTPRIIRDLRNAGLLKGDGGAA
jgi:hypothetical protein